MEHIPVFWVVFKRSAGEDYDSDSDGDYDSGVDSDDDDSSQGHDDNDDDSSSDDAGTRKAGQHGSIGDDTGVGAIFEIRHHRHLVIKTMGRALRASLGPRKLLRAIQHAVIGHCALFTEGGYLHGDVSPGNIIVIPEPVVGKIPDALSSVVQSHECIAVLIDGDVAKQWRGVEKTPHPHTGTLPFISTSLANKRRERMPEFHTPIDDLESFIWVLLYELVHWSHTRTTIEQLWWDGFNAGTVQRVALEKQSVVSKWVDKALHQTLNLSQYVHLFRAVLHELFVSMAAYSKAVETMIRKASQTEFLALFNDAYKDFIQISEKHISRLPNRFPALK
ncbi:hypothetical protein HGRIS_011809 [Hohenbuehelia grisea]|uniref:Fungal-type protein kinase domain-containing protein n=1 Tax=Hohenbuehelia grisea TaxID=104357 RepID=A0ABR3JYB6_9AGAR